MYDIFTTIRLFLLCATVLILAFLVLLSWPESRLRCFLLKIGGRFLTLLTALHVVSPSHRIPEFTPVLGPIDDTYAKHWKPDLPPGFPRDRHFYRPKK